MRGARVTLRLQHVALSKAVVMARCIHDNRHSQILQEGDRNIMKEKEQEKRKQTVRQDVRPRCIVWRHTDG